MNHRPYLYRAYSYNIVRVLTTYCSHRLDEPASIRQQFRKGTGEKP